MPLVTVKSKFQVTIPARLRKGIDLREGDIMEATLMGDGILFRPKRVVDTRAGDTRAGDTRAGDTRAGDTRAGDTRAGDTRAGDRDAAADRIAAAVSAGPPLPEDVGRTEDEIMEDTIADIAQSRRERRSRDT